MVICAVGCRHKDSGRMDAYGELESMLLEIVEDKLGKIGIAVIIDSTDTIVVNNDSDYPLMSMFKLHEALAVCDKLDADSVGLDAMMTVNQENLNPDTWSPMFKKHSAEDSFSISVGRLIEYILVDSDNNASNLLFEKVVSVTETDSIMRSFVSDGNFALKYKESEMQADHGLAYENRSSPLAYSVLVNKLFTDSIVSPEKQNYIKNAMEKCDTGMKRLAGPLVDKNGVRFAHRTGSGYVNSRGQIVAVNDGGYVILPSGKEYAITVLVKDYAGTQEEAESVISEISETVYEFINER